MSKVSSILKASDVFGSKYDFSIQGSDSIKTIAGGIMSVLISLFFLFVIIAFGQDFYHKKNPKVLIQQKIQTDQELYALNNYTMENKTMIVMVEKDLDKIIDFVVDANRPYTLQKSRVSDILRPCSQEFVIETFFKGNITNALDSLTNEYTYLCYDFSSMRFGLHDSGEGSGSLLVTPVSIWTFRCGRTARGQKAKECPANFNSTASPSNRGVQVWSYKVLFDPDNVEKPFADSLTRFGSFELTRNSDVDLYLQMGVHDNHDNQGFFMDTDVITSTIGVDYGEVNVIPLDKPKDFYDMSIYIGFTKTYYKYQRTYMKVQDLLAQVGGVIKAVFTFFQVFSYFFNSYYLDTYVLSLTQKHKLTYTEKKLNDISNSKLDLTKDKSVADVKQSKINNFMDKRSESHDFSLRTDIKMFEYLKYLFCCGTEDVIRSVKYVKKMTSVENLIESNTEFLHLKSMLFNDHQQIGFKLLNFITENHSIDEDTYKELKDYHAQKVISKTLNEFDKYIFTNSRLKLD